MTLKKHGSGVFISQTSSFTLYPSSLFGAVREKTQNATGGARQARSQRATAMHQAPQATSLSDHTLCDGHEIFRGSQPADRRHRLPTDANPHHPRQGSQATSSSALTETTARATRLLETVQTSLATLSRQLSQLSGQDLRRHHDSKNDQGLGTGGRHQEGHHSAHTA